jgi:hypothetical protein
VNAAPRVEGAIETPIHALLATAIDYAGLFPPAALPMSDAVAEYARLSVGCHAWALGRFILSAARLEEFARVFASQSGAIRWRLSALIGADVAGDLLKVETFNHSRAGPRPASLNGALLVDTLEFKTPTAESVAEMARLANGRFATFYEFPHMRDPDEFLSAIARAGGRAKIRTGGLTADAIPKPAALARFLEQSAALRVPFKATAGLHHPLRGVYRLTYESGSPTATMYGFVNLALAVAFARAGWKAEQLVPILGEQSPDAFRFDADGASWREHRLASDDLKGARAESLVSFGSCSFDEPITELQALGWL